MLTGATLYLYLQQKIGKPYSAFLNPTRGNRLVREAMYRASEMVYRGLDAQREYDELSVLIKTGQIYTPIANIVSLSPARVVSFLQSGGPSPTITMITQTPHWMVTGSTLVLSGVTGMVMVTGNINGTWPNITKISDTSFSFVATGIEIASGAYGGLAIAYNSAQTVLDYYHYLRSAAKYVETLTPVITGVSIAADGILTTDIAHNLREGDPITIAGITGTSPVTNLNASHTVTEIITDTKFRVGVSTAGGTYASGGTLTRTIYNDCVQYVSDKKIALFGQPTVLKPRVEFTQNALKIYGAKQLSAKACVELEFDYVSTPAIEPDMSNAIIDLELYFSKPFLYLIMDKAAEDFAGQVKDQRLLQTQQMAIRDNA